jgi:hypothetical protein
MIINLPLLPTEVAIVPGITGAIRALTTDENCNTVMVGGVPVCKGRVGVVQIDERILR